MTKEEIIAQGNFLLDERNPKYSEFRISLFLNFFKQEKEIVFFNLPSFDSEPKMSVLVDIINELLNYDESNKEWLMEKIWNDFELCMREIEYGMVPYEGFESDEAANRAYFKINNQQDALNAVKLHRIWVDIDFTEFRYFNLSFNCPWETEHGINIGVKNGEFDSMN